MILSCSEARKMMIIWSLWLIFSNTILVVIASHSEHLCLPDQRDALWEFTNEFYVDSNVPNFEKMTEKWRNNTDCCSWDGVSCDPKTGKIVELYLETSSLNGILPDSIGNLKYLSRLGCHTCNLHGEIPSSLGNLSYLADLDLAENHFTSEGPNLQLVLPKLRSLISIYLGYNQFKVDLGRNQFSGPLEIGNISSPSKLQTLFLNDNHFNGPIPESLSKLVELESLDLSFWNKGRDIVDLREIPKRLCALFELQALDLSNNNFSGSIPRCFENFNTTLKVLHLQNNSLSGVFPEESISLGLRSLDVGHNQLSGELPKSLINCTYLEFLNVEGNRINDTFPFGVSLLPHLQVLVLRSNEFHGPVSHPRDSFSFPNLRIFDISDNRFSGVLPSDYFVGWNAVSSVVEVEDYRYGIVVAGGIRRYYYSSVVLTNKGLKMELVGSVFKMYKTIDVSRNRFEGDIPESIGLLKELIVLNMSNNAFTGCIPQSLTNLTNLQSLDLSQNRLSGEIPPQLGKLTFLERMNFSYNMLDGPIPQGTQIQSQNSSSFAENPGLCGAPLEDTCGGGGEEEATKEEQDEEKEEKEQVFSWIAAAIAYVPGVVCGLTIAYILTS
ncbi:hypothetical protein AALP_AAs71336U000100 [Arabis alpina]|uniref:Leucine-rich repeat-containing N-terminal plant-type domain-containing protein n=1 Tax=Arabis alpina TaxID=50452 RepID=A0A087FYS3_ARAAL|nr:hypothetical protein AALP_AAs71336U000100 [Arabis alpina]